jgi:hypothetical protein
MVNCQHPNIIQYLLADVHLLNVKKRGVEPLFLIAFYPAAKLIGGTRDLGSINPPLAIAVVFPANKIKNSPPESEELLKGFRFNPKSQIPK